MSRQHLGALQRGPVPQLDRVVPQAGHDLLIVVLKAVDALAVLGPTVDLLEDVPPVAPVALDRLDVGDDFRVKSAVEYVRTMVFARSGFEQILNPGNGKTRLKKKSQS